MNARRIIIAALAALALSAVAAPAAQARAFEGEIVARDGKAKSFSIREDEGGGTFKLKVTKATGYQGIAGFKAVRVGRTDLEVTARKANGRWIATVVERRGAGNDD